MNITFDAQPLIDNQKTGVGFCEAGIVSALLHSHKGREYALDYFSFQHGKDKEMRLKSFIHESCVLNPCAWFPGTLYRAIWNFIPIPYRCFFGKKAHVTHFFNYHVPPGVHGKKVATVHDMGYKVFPETVRLKTKIMLNLSLNRSCKRADKLITDSEFSKQEIMRFLKIEPDKIVVVPCGVDTANFYPITDNARIQIVKQSNKIYGDYFLYLGTLEPRKNIERLIEAYAVLKQDKPDAPALVLAGRKGWLYETIFERVTALGLINDVIFTGYVTDEDAPILLSGALAFVFPSLYEGFGMPPLEAMACGTPVLTSNCSSLPEVVGDAAILVDPYSVEEIRQGMQHLMEDEVLRQELSAKGLARAKEFTWERSADIVMSVYKELVGQDE